MSEERNSLPVSTGDNGPVFCPAVLPGTFGPQNQERPEVLRAAHRGSETSF